jgi:hypothetical protein
MENGKYILELAKHISIRNINFYIDTYKAMSAVDLSETDHGDLIKLESLAANGRIKDTTNIDIPGGMKTLGKFLITRARKGNFAEKGDSFIMIPFTFLGSAIVGDLKLHGQGPNYEFVEKFMDELADQKIINPDCLGPRIRAVCEQYERTDLAAIFLGYSIASHSAFRPLIPFPANPEGFIPVLISEFKKLLPRCLQDA